MKFAEVKGKYTSTCWGDLEEIEHLGDLDIDGKVILKLIIKDRVCGLFSSGSEWEQVSGFFEHSNEHLGSINGADFLAQKEFSERI